MNIRSYIQFVSRTGVLAASFVGAVLLSASFTFFPFGNDLLDANLTYTHEEALAIIEAYGEEGRRTYMTLSLSVDMLLPIVYVSFLVGALRRSLTGFRASAFAGIAFAAGTLDVLENTQIATILAQFPDISTIQTSLTSLTTRLKWAMLIASLAAIFISVAIRIFKRGFNRTQ